MKFCSFLILVLFTRHICMSDDLLTCDVGELPDPGLLAGPCNSNNATQDCIDYCQQQYGAKSVGAMCSDERPNQKRECICQLKCCNGACCDSPHCWDIDISKISYHGFLKYHLITPCTKLTSLPTFDVRQLNQAWPMQSTEITELLVPDWGIRLEILGPDDKNDNFTLRVDGKDQIIPFSYSKLEDYKENYIRVNYLDDHGYEVLVKTSFGLQIKLNSLSEDNSIATKIYIPSHPELRSNICGKLGGWTDISTGLNADSNITNQRDLDPGFSTSYFENWIVTDEHTSTETIDQDDLAKICRQKLRSQMVTNCAAYYQVSLPSIDDCITDLSNFKNKSDRQYFLDAMLDSISDTCNISAVVPASCCTQKLTPLHRLYHPKATLHFLTISTNESARFQANLGYSYEFQAASVAMNGSPLRCGKSGLIGMYRLKTKKTQERFYVADPNEMAVVMKSGNYLNEGIAFYCVSVAGQCGATVAFHRYLIPVFGEHFYTTDLNEGNANVIPLGGNYEGIACYVWPNK